MDCWPTTQSGRLDFNGLSDDDFGRIRLDKVGRYELQAKIAPVPADRPAAGAGDKCARGYADNDCAGSSVLLLAYRDGRSPAGCTGAVACTTAPVVEVLDSGGNLCTSDDALLRRLECVNSDGQVLAIHGQCKSQR